MPAVPQALRRLRALARSSLASRAALVRFRDTERSVEERILDVAGLAFDGGRWLVAAWAADRGSLRLLELSRITRVRATRRRAGRLPADFDPRDFALRHVLDPDAGPARCVTLWLDDRLAALAPALLPTARLAPAPGGGWTCRARTSRPGLVLALARSLAPWGEVHSPSLMLRTGRKDRELTPESRLLRLAAWLLAQGEPASRRQIYEAFPDEYGGTAEASERKFSRDKDALRELGYVIEVVDLGRKDDPLGYLLAPRSCALPPVELSPEEALLVWSAALGALRVSDHPLREDLEAALRKLVAAGKGLPPRAAPIEELAGEEGGVEPRVLDQLVGAWERRKRTTIQYWRVGTGEVAERDVDVYGWASRRGEWIFVGYCHLRKGVRIFYLSRVRKLKVNAVRPQDSDYQVPRDFDIRRWSRQQVWDYDVHPPRTATIRFRGSLARLVRHLLPGARLATDAEGARVARLDVRNLRGLVRQALAWGPEAELVEPEDGRAMAREILSALAGAGARSAP